MDTLIYCDRCLIEHNTPLLGLSVPLSRMSNDCPGRRVKSNLWINLAITTLASICEHTGGPQCDRVNFVCALVSCVFVLNKG